MGKQVICAKEHRYAGVQRKPGDRYELKGDGTDRAVLALGLARLAPPEVVVEAAPRPTSGTYLRRDIVAVDNNSAHEVRRAPAAKKTGTRRSKAETTE